MRTQKNLTAEFCVHYILNDRFQYTSSEDWITLGLIASEQPHLTIEVLKEFISKEESDSDSDSDSEDAQEKQIG